MTFARTHFEDRRWFFGLIRAPRRGLSGKPLTRFPAKTRETA